MKVPNGYAICENQLFAMVNKLVDVDVDQTEIGKFLPPVYNTLAGLTREELIQKFVSLEFNRFITYYKDSKDINITSDKKEKEKDFKSKSSKQPGQPKGKHTQRRSSGNTQRFFMNAGALDKIRKGAIVRVICNKSGISSDKIGNIEIMREFTFFEVDNSAADTVLNKMKGAAIDGKKINVQFADNKKSGKKKKKR